MIAFGRRDLLAIGRYIARDNPDAALRRLPPVGLLLRLQTLLVTRTTQDVGQRVIPLVTGVLVDTVVQRPERDLASPRAGVGRGIVDRELVQDAAFHPCETLGHSQVLKQTKSNQELNK